MTCRPGGAAVGRLDADVDVDRAQRLQRGDRAGLGLGGPPGEHEVGRRCGLGLPHAAVVVAVAAAPDQLVARVGAGAQHERLVEELRPRLADAELDGGRRCVTGLAVWRAGNRREGSKRAR